MGPVGYITKRTQRSACQICSQHLDTARSALFLFLCLFIYFLCLFHESQCSKAMQSLRLPAYMCSCSCLRRPRCPFCHISSCPGGVCQSAYLCILLPVLPTMANATQAYPPWLPFVLVQLVPPPPPASFHLPIPLFFFLSFSPSFLPVRLGSHLDHFAWASIMWGPPE